MKEEVFTTVQLTNGEKPEIINPLALNISRVQFRAVLYSVEEIDFGLLLCQELCLFEGRRKNLEYFKNLSIEDYARLMEVISVMVKPINDHLS